MKKVLCVVTSNNVKGATGIPTGFWLIELTHPMAMFEDAAQGTAIVPFLLADKLKEHGAIHHAAANWSNNVVIDGRLVTGQNPASAANVGDAVVRLLK